MPSKYEKVPKRSKRVSFDDTARFNFEAPRNSNESHRSLGSPYHAPEDNRDDSDDEIDTLLAEDPLYEEKESLRKQTRSGARLGRKKRRVLIFGLVTLLLGLFAALTVVGIKAHGRHTDVVSPQSAAELKAQMDAASLAETVSMTEVPSLTGMLPINDRPSPISPVPVPGPVSGEEDQVISVPPTVINWDNEEADKAAYEAAAAYVPEDYPSLSEEAVGQAQGLNAALDEASASMAATAENSAAKIEAHKGDPLQSMMDTANDLWAWLDAKWDDMMGNTWSSDETIY